MSEKLVGDASAIADVSVEALKGFVAHRRIRHFDLGETADSAFKEARAKWESEYACDLSEARIPEHQDGFDWLVIIRKGLWPNEAYERLGELTIPAWRYTNDLNGIMSVREPFERSYGAWLRKGQEADDEFRNKSFNDLWRIVNGITVTERLVAERDWFKETAGGHLDEKSWTLCTGSYYFDDGVPRVSLDVGEVSVFRYFRRSVDACMGTRQVVS